MSQEIPFDNSVFNSRLSFLPLIASLKKAIAEGKPGSQKLYGGLIESFEAIPELLQPIEETSLLEKHNELVEMLLATVFPPTNSEADNLYAVALPFTFNTIYSSHLFHHSFLKAGTNEINVPEGIAYKLFSEKLLNAYYMVLEKYSAFKAPLHPRSVYPLHDPVTRLRKYFEVQIDSRFVEVKTIDGRLPEIPKDAICNRTNRMMELSRLYDVLPLNQFVFEGIVIVRICDVTDQEVISEIKNTLLSTNAFYDTAVYETLQLHIQTLLGLKEVKIGITPFFKVTGHFVYSELHNSNSPLFRHFTQLHELKEVDECCKQLFFE